jgi:nicotinamidase/pyrazinamidase
MKNASLLIIDLQNDFCPGGALPVEEGDMIVPVINDYISAFREKKLPILATRDWHPENTTHFKKFGGDWPVHCVQGTAGAEFHPDLRLPYDVVIISGGMDPGEDGYSCFEGKDEKGQVFNDFLTRKGITDLFVCGIATDYCVKYSVLDALEQGYEVYLLTDAIKGVNLKPQDSQNAAAEMVEKGARTATIAEVKALLRQMD